MKKTILTLNLVLMTLLMLAQAPNSFNYQAAVRDADGKVLANKAVSFRISIIENSASGSVAYSETHSATTNEYGLVNLEIGNGTSGIGNFSSIDWGSAAHFIKTEIDASGGSSYTEMSTQQLMSVPYALNAKTAESVTNDQVDDADADATNELQTLTLSGNSLELSNGGGAVSLPSDGDADANNELQTISKTGNTIVLSNSGGTITLDPTDGIQDADNDTKIVLDQTADDDMIRFYQEGTEFFRMDNGRIEVINSNENVVLGDSALTANQTGIQNTAIGHHALLNNTSGSYNTAIGRRTLRDNTTGYSNTAIGASALLSNTTGHDNIASGILALESNTTGDYNIATGYLALNQNDSGDFNIATGIRALRNNTTGDYNIGLGRRAGFTTTTGGRNTFMGTAAAFSNTTGSNLIAIGDSAMYRSTTASSNIAIGKNALFSNITGDQNTAVGYEALRNTTSIHNTALGHQAGGGLTSGFSSTFIGTRAGEGFTTGNYNTIMGYRAGWNPGGISNTYVGAQAGPNSALNNVVGIGYNVTPTASNQVRIGNSAITSIGGQVGWTAVSDGRFKVNVKEDVKGLDFIMNLRPVTYNLDVYEIAKFTKEDERYEDGVPQHMKEARKEKYETVQTGFIAQEVEAAADSLGYDFSGVDAPKNENDFYGLRYAEFVVPLVKGMQEQQATIRKQEATNRKLQLTVTEQEAKIIEMQRQLAELAAVVSTLTEE